jgi:hypothetical protein
MMLCSIIYQLLYQLKYILVIWQKWNYLPVFRIFLDLSAFPYNKRFTRNLGSAAAKIYAIGACGEIISYNGVSWSEMVKGYSSNKSLFDIYGFAWNNVLSVGMNGRVIHYDGSTWNAASKALVEAK